MNMTARRRERIEELLDERLAEITDNSADMYYQSRDISYLTQALLNIIRIEAEENRYGWTNTYSGKAGGEEPAGRD